MELSNTLLSLYDIFENKIFRIPDYQRGYSWEAPQLNDFWSDLINLREGQPHYTGYLSLKNLTSEVIKGNPKYDIKASSLLEPKGSYTYWHVIDGQQRLTTSIILIHEIVQFAKELQSKDGSLPKTLDGIALDSIEEHFLYITKKTSIVTKTYVFGYEQDNPSYFYLCHKILADDNAPSGAHLDDTYYTKNLNNAKEFFKANIRRITNYSPLEQSEELSSSNHQEQASYSRLERLFHRITRQFMLIISEIDDQFDVFVAFETINNRGKKLSNLELLKNRLIYLTTLFNDIEEYERESLREQINSSWKEIYRQLGRNKDFTLNDDDFLRAHWILFFRYNRHHNKAYVRDLLTRFSVGRIYTDTNNFQECSLVTEKRDSDFTELNPDDDYSDNNQDTQDIVTKSSLSPQEIQDYVKDLESFAKFWYESFFPYEGYSIDSKEQTWVEKLNNIGLGYFRPMVAAAIALNSDNGKRLELFKAIERNIFILFRMGRAFSTLNNSRCYNLGSDLYHHKISLNELILKINELTESRRAASLENFCILVKDRFERHDAYYSWGTKTYFFYEYELSLQNNHKGSIKKLSWETITSSNKDKVSIEHILPQTPKDPYWKEQFKGFSSEQIKMLSGALGNLLPLSFVINASLQNDCFEIKKNGRKGSDDLQNRGYKLGSHSEIEVAQERDWDARRIYERSAKLIDFMNNRWNLQLSDAQRQTLIYIDFAINPPSKIAEQDQEPSQHDQTRPSNMAKSEQEPLEQSNIHEAGTTTTTEQSSSSSSEPQADVRATSEQSSSGYSEHQTGVMTTPEQSVSGYREKLGEGFVKDKDKQPHNKVLSDLQTRQLKFWQGFEDYCREKQRPDLVKMKGRPQHWYNIFIGSMDFYIEVSITYDNVLNLAIYCRTWDFFYSLFDKKDQLEELVGVSLDWSSKDHAKKNVRVILRSTGEHKNEEHWPECFTWFIEQYDVLVKALKELNFIK